MAKNNPSKWYTSKENDEQRIRAYIAGNELHIEVGQSGTSDVFPPKKNLEDFHGKLHLQNSHQKREVQQWDEPSFHLHDYILSFQPLNL